MHHHAMDADALPLAAVGSLFARRRRRRHRHMAGYNETHSTQATRPLLLLGFFPFFFITRFAAVASLLMKRSGETLFGQLAVSQQSAHVTRIYCYSADGIVRASRRVGSAFFLTIQQWQSPPRRPRLSNV